jgi:lipoprotein-releasing system permease protein
MPATNNLALFIARRYLLSKRTLNFITIITAIAGVGIAIGVAALIVILSVFNGFQGLVERFLVGFDPHVRVVAASGGFVQEADSLAERVQQALKPFAAGHGVTVSAAAIAGGKIVVIKNKSMLACELRGIDTTRIDAVSGLRASLVAGVFTVQPREDGFMPVVMGIGLADKLRLAIGDTISLLAPSAIEAAIAQASPPTTTRAVMVGLFQSNNKDYDAWQMYTSIEGARRLLAIPTNAALSVDVRCGDASLSDEAAERLRTALHSEAQQQNARYRIDPQYRIETWFDLHKDLYVVMRFERLAAFAVLTIIILVAVFNIFASLSMSVAEKRAEIGMLKAMGASSKLITQIFFMQAALVGVMGTMAGIILGVGLCWGQERFAWFALDTSRYVIPAIPIILSWTDVAVVCLVTVTLALVAGFVPARRAGQMESIAQMLGQERA